MGKYTSLACLPEETRPQKKGVVTKIDNTYKHSILIDTANNTASTLHDNDTNLRTTNLTNLTEQAGGTSVFLCIHRLPSKECAVCSGYVRWLIADEERVRRAQNNPEAVRREFWRATSAEDRQAVDEMVTKTPASFLAKPGEDITVAELQARQEQEQNAGIAGMPPGKAEGESDPDDSAGGLGGHLRGIRDAKRAAKAGHE